MNAARGRGETFLTGVDFGDGHGGVAERKVGWVLMDGQLAIYAHRNGSYSLTLIISATQDR
jgi:hypothetical protein